VIAVEILEERIFHIRICRPEKRNALGVADYEQLAGALNDIGDAAVVVLSSEGNVFCAGNDLAEFSTEWPQPKNGPIVRFLTALSNVPVPVIAIVQGPAVGIGATMLLHCDIVIAGRDASLRYPFVSLGLAPEGASSLLLPQTIGRQRAMELLLTGRAISADEAVTLGLVTFIGKSADLMQEGMVLAGTIGNYPRAAVVATKTLLLGPSRSTVEHCFELEIETINELILQSSSASL